MSGGNPKFYVRKMLLQFQLPGSDCMNENMFSPTGNSLWDSGIFISTNQSKNFYTDIFQFWVRALFCFFENLSDNSSLQSVTPFVECGQISPKQFEKNLSKLITEHVPDRNSSFAFKEFRELSFSKAFAILHGSEIESAVAELGGKFDREYIAYFHQTKQCIRRCM